MVCHPASTESDVVLAIRVARPDGRAVRTRVNGLDPMLYGGHPVRLRRAKWQRVAILFS